MISLAWFVAQATAGKTSVLGGMVIGHLLFVFGPPALFALLLTSDPARTLRLRWPRWSDLILAGLLAAALNPAVRELGVAVSHWFPASETVKAKLAELMGQTPNLGISLLVFALMPALTEEVAFRGYILSGLERSYRPMTAVLLSALLFAFLHVLLSLFQQFFGAAILGVILGLIAYRTGSLWPGVVFHFVNNALGVATTEIARHAWVAPWSGWVLRDSTEGLYQLPIEVGGLLVGAVLFALIWRGHPDRPPARDELSGPVVG